MKVVKPNDDAFLGKAQPTPVTGEKDKKVEVKVEKGDEIVFPAVSVVIENWMGMILKRFDYCICVGGYSS